MTCIAARLTKSIPNLITLSRILLTCIATLYIYRYFGSIFVPLVISLVIFLSDYLDGYIARRFGNTSWLGSILDIAADLFYIVSTYIVLYVFDVLPFWFFLVIIFKFVEFLATSYLLKKSDNEKFRFVFDIMGRTAAVFFYIIPIFSYVAFKASPAIYYFITQIFIKVITILSVTSSFYRISSLVFHNHNLDKLKLLNNIE